MKKQKQNISASIDAAGDSVTKEKRERNNETDKYDLNDAMNLSMNKKQRLEQEESIASTSGISTGIPNVTSTPTGLNTNKPFTPTSTYNIYQNLAQGTNLPSNPSPYHYNTHSGFGNQHVYSSSKYLSGIQHGYHNYNLYSSLNKPYSSLNQISQLANIPKPTLPEKQKYIIKDMPQMTVGSFLHNKNIQDKYLSEIKKTEPEGNEETSGVNVTNVSINNNTTNLNGPTNVTNVNIHNYNYNYTITNTHPLGKSNNIVIQTKTVQPQTNKTLTTMNTMLDTLGNNLLGNSLGGALSTPIATPLLNQNPQSQITGALTIPVGGFQKTPQGQQNKSGEFGESLQRYIQRSYEKCKTDFDTTKCQNALKKIIGAALKKGELNTRNWDEYPLPVLPSQEAIIEPKPKSEAFMTVLSDQEIKKRESRKERFTNITLNTSTGRKQIKISEEEPNVSSTNTIIIGTCTNLEKEYLRLTSVPDPSQIRPEHILKKSLKLLKEKWKNKTADYNYISEQFRSIRQDMTIQHIQNEFTVKVYETHARIALECGDIGQFNQCQTGLIPLYSKNIKGNYIEFLAYRIIYTTLYDKTELVSLIKQIDSKEKKIYEIIHAIKVMKAINDCSYFEFFKLYKVSPNMGGYLIEPFLPRIRIKALQVMALGYYTEIDISFVSNQLGFKSPKDCVAFLEENSLMLKGEKMLCKDNIQVLNSSKYLSTVLQKNI